MRPSLGIISGAFALKNRAFARENGLFCIVWMKSKPR
jgi:hypothetical protein